MEYWRTKWKLTWRVEWNLELYRFDRTCNVRGLSNGKKVWGYSATASVEGHQGANLATDLGLLELVMVGRHAPHGVYRVLIFKHFQRAVMEASAWTAGAKIVSNIMLRSVSFSLYCTCTRTVLWSKSCTTSYSLCRRNSRILKILSGAGFCPSTVVWAFI